MIPQQQADAEMGMAAPGAFRARAARRLPPAHPQPFAAGVQMSRGPTAGVAPPTTMGMGMGAQMGATGMMPPGTAMRMPGGMAPPTAMGAPVMPGTGMAPGTGMRVGTAMMMLRTLARSMWWMPCWRGGRAQACRTKRTARR